jgi:hypothetical protein
VKLTVIPAQAEISLLYSASPRRHPKDQRDSSFRWNGGWKAAETLNASWYRLPVPVPARPLQHR